MIATRIDKARNTAMVLMLAACAGMVTPTLVWPQNGPQDSSQDSSQDAPRSATHDTPPAQTDPAPASSTNPGLINEIGKLFTIPTLTLPSLPTLKSPAETLNDLNARAKDATDGLPNITTMVKGRMTCPVSANGAPDCKIASDKLCQSKGFKEGKSLDTDSARSCSAKSLLAGGKPPEGECKTENYVTRALCQ